MQAMQECAKDGRACSPILLHEDTQGYGPEGPSSLRARVHG